MFKFFIDWLSDEDSVNWHGYLYLGIILVLLLLKLIFGRLAVVYTSKGEAMLKNIVQVS